MRIVGFGADNPASSDYRCFAWLRSMERRGHTVWRGDLTRLDQIMDKVRDAEIVLVGRQNDPRFFAALLAGRDLHGYRLVVDTDDYTDGLPEEHLSYGGWAGAAMTKKMARAQYKNADQVICATPFLADIYRDLNPNIAVVPNCVDLARYAKVRKVEKEPRHRTDVRIYWAGGMSHYGDLALLRPAYEHILHGFPAVKFVFAANVPDWAMAFPWDRVFFCRFADFSEFPQAAAWTCSDIAVAPLADHPFNRAKSHVKYLEYGMAGMAGVYQAMEPYATIQDGTTGLLAGTPEEWTAALARLIVDNDLRRKIADAASADLLHNWTVERHADRYDSLLQEVLTRQPQRFMPLEEATQCPAQMS